MSSLFKNIDLLHPKWPTLAPKECIHVLVWLLVLSLEIIPIYRA